MIDSTAPAPPMPLPGVRIPFVGGPRDGHSIMYDGGLVTVGDSLCVKLLRSTSVGVMADFYRLGRDDDRHVFIFWFSE